MIRKLAATIALVGSVALTLLPAVAAASLPFGWDRVYYAEAEHTTPVGEETRYCNNQVSLWWGVRSAYYETVTFPCE